MNEDLPLYRDLERYIVRNGNVGNRNYLFAYFGTWLSIISGMLATIAASVGTTELDTRYPSIDWNLVIATLAALPVANTTAIAVFNVREKIRWYRNTKVRAEELFARLRDDPHAVTSDVSRQFTKLKLDHETTFPGFNTNLAK